MTNPRQRIDRPCDRGGKRCIVAHPARGVGDQLHGVLPLARLAAVADDGVHPFETSDRLAQRPHRQQAGVAETARSVHHHQLDVAGQRIVLQTVVGDDDIHLTALLQQSYRVGPFRGNHHRTAAAPGNQHRLISGLRSGASLIQPIGVMGRLATITTAHHPGTIATGLQLLHQPDHHRRLAVAPHRNIAHHDHPQGGAIPPAPAVTIGIAAAAADDGKQQGKGGQQPAPATFAIPEPFQHQALLPALPN